MSNLSIRLDHIVAKLETAPGTAEVLADEDFDSRCFDISFTPTIEMDDNGEEVATGSHTEQESIAGATWGEISFSTWMCWGGAVGTEPNNWKFLRGCGAKATTYPTEGTAVGIGLTPEKSQDAISLTMYGYKLERGGAAPSALQFQFVGCVGNAVVSAANIGGKWMAKYTFKGKLVDIVDVAYAALLEMTSPDTTIAEKMLLNTVTVGGPAMSVSSIELDFGNVVELQTDQTNATGYSQAVIINRKPRLRMNPYMKLAASDDVFAIMTGATIGAVVWTSAPETPHLTISAPRAQLIAADVGSREGSATYEKTFKLLRNTAGADDVAKERTWQILQGAVA